MELLFGLYASVLGVSGQVSVCLFALNLSIFVGERMLFGDAAVRGYGSGGGWKYDGGICYGGREGIVRAGIRYYLNVIPFGTN